MAGEVIEEAFVEVHARISQGFAADVKRMVDRALKNVRGEVDIVARDNFRVVQRSAQRALNGIRSEARRPIDVEMRVRNPELVAKVENDIAELRREAARRLELDINADTSDVTDKIKVLQNKLRILEADKIEVKVDADTAGASAQLAAFDRQLKDSSDNGRSFGDTLRNAFRGVGEGVTSALGGILKIGGGLASLAPLAGILAGAAAAATALGGALGLAAGSAISLAGVGASLGAAFAAVKIASIGVSDAMSAQIAAQKELAETGEVSAATQEKLDAAMKNLAPAARGVVKAIAAMKGPFDDLRKNLQQSLFKGFGDRIREVGRTLLPILEDSLIGVTGALNQAGHGFADFVTSAQGSEQIRNIMEGLSQTFQALLPAFGNVGRALLNLFEGAIPSSVSLAENIVGITERFQQFTERITASGQFQEFLSRASEAAGALLSVLGNLGRVLAGVFGAGADEGVGILQSMSDALGNLADKINTVAGQQVLQDFFDTIGFAGQTLGRLFETLAPLIGDLVSAAAPGLRALSELVGSLAETFLTVLGPALTTVVQAISDVLVAITPTITAFFESLSPTTLAVIAAAIGAIGTALLIAFGGPVGAAIAAIAVLVGGLVAIYQQSETVRDIIGTLGDVLQGAFEGVDLSGVINAFKGLDLSTLFDGLSEGFEAIKGVMEDVAPIVQKLFQGYFQTAGDILQNVVIPAIQQIADFIGGTLLPHLADLADSFKANVVPAIEALVDTFVDDIMPAMEDFWQTISNDVLPVVLDLGKFLLKVAKPIQKVGLFIVGFLLKALAKIGPVIKIVIKAITLVIKIIAKIIGAVVDVANAVADAVGAIIDFFADLPGNIGKAINAVIKFFKDLPGNILSALSSLGSTILNAFSTAFTAVYNFVSNGISTIVGFYLALPGQIVGALANMGPTIAGVFRNLFNAARGIITKGITAIVGFFRSLPQRAGAAARGLIDRVLSIFRNLFNAARGLVTKGITAIVNFFKSLPQKVFTAARAVIDRVLTIFRNLFNAARGLVSRGITTIVNFFKSLPDKIRSVGTQMFNAGKHLISRVFAGLKAVAGGAGGVASALAAAVKGALNQVIDAFNNAIPNSIGVPGLPDIDLPDNPIPRLAKGGIIKRAVVALVGEAGPEAVLPIRDPARAAQLLAQSGLADLPAIQRTILDRLAPSLAETTGSLRALRGQSSPLAAVPRLSQTSQSVLSRAGVGTPRSTGGGTTVVQAPSSGPTRVVNNKNDVTINLPMADPTQIITAIETRLFDDAER